MKITATAPSRIDLAGGTLDIFPLYLFEGGGLTINLAINLLSRVEIESLPEEKYRLESEDLGLVEEAPALDRLDPRGNLGLLARAVRFMEPEEGLSVKTCNTAPSGSGLGASSSLLIALLGALGELTDNHPPRHELVDWAANLEAQALGIPTGKQDYYAALCGGLNAIWFTEKGIVLESLMTSQKDFTEFESRLILSFTGISHFSGTNNWNMMKRYIDGERRTVHGLGRIRETAFRMREALLARDFDAVAIALREEWENRKALAEGVTNERIEAMIAAADKAGAEASKICGAGGGGCLVTLASPARREAVKKALAEAGGRVLDFSIESRGLSVSSSGGGS